MTPDSVDAGKIRTEVTIARGRLRGDLDTRSTLDALLRALDELAGPEPERATVVLFKPSGKYYTEERWRIPADGAIGPVSMERSPDFRRIEGGPVLVPEQEPWGYPHLFPSER